MLIKLFNMQHELIHEITDTKTFEFSGGEVHVELPDVRDHGNDIAYTVIVAKVKTSVDVMELLMVTDALRRLLPGIPVSLLLPYLPYARQDKITVIGESLSIKVFADLINAQNYQSVMVFDVHSEVSKALFNNLLEFEQHHLVLRTMLELDMNFDNTVLVAPDAGAAKKIYKLAQESPTDVPVVIANKVRDSKGNIIETAVFCADFEGKDAFIVDDIADGGRTFTELAKVLKVKNCGNITLYVTHGIFSKGFTELFDSGIVSIITTNSFIDDVDDERVKIIDISAILR
jgi:ribose-phosphate pyrophosphokinase